MKCTASKIFFIFFTLILMTACVQMKEIIIINDRSYSISQSGDEKAIQTRILHAAIDANSLDYAKKALDGGALIDAYLSQGETPLVFAIKKNNYSMVKFLIERGVNINKRGIYNRIPLMEAVSGENIEIVKLLMVNGADLNATDSNGLTALFYCLNSNNMVTMLEIAKVISEKSGYSQPGVSSFWIAFGAKIKGYDIAKSKGSILILSIVQGNFELVKTLIERGADINAADEEGNTPLILSVVYNNADIAKYLIEKGAHKNTKNNYSKTASDYLNKNNSSLVELFK